MTWPVEEKGITKQVVEAQERTGSQGNSAQHAALPSSLLSQLLAAAHAAGARSIITSCQPMFGPGPRQHSTATPCLPAQPPTLVPGSSVVSAAAPAGVTPAAPVCKSQAINSSLCDSPASGCAAAQRASTVASAGTFTPKVTGAALWEGVRGAQQCRSCQDASFQPSTARGR